MKVLTFSSLFPNSQSPNHGVFIKERMKAWKEKTQSELVVVAPVPWFPKTNMLSCFKKWHQFSQVPNEEMIEGIQVYHPRYLVIPKIGMLFHGWLIGICVIDLIKRLQIQHSFDLIDAHFVYPDGTAVQKVSAILKIPYVVSARGSDIHQFSKFYTIRPQIKKVLNKANHIISVSQGLKDIMVGDLKILPKKITVIGNGVDTNKFYPIEQKEARRHCRLPYARTIVLSVGALIPRKNYIAYLTAIKQLSERNIIAVIIGEGPERRKLEKFIKDNELNQKAMLIGSVAHDELVWWYSAADLFCLTSIKEGWANVLMEAMACGLPSVATPAIGSNEIITNQSLGIITQGFGSNEIIDALQKGLSTIWNKDHIRKHAEGQDWSWIADRVQVLFESMAKQ